jgi:hypothetical protein
MNMDDDAKEFVCSYHMDGSQWGLTVMAKDFKDASRRLRAIGTTGQVDGELVARIPAYPSVGIGLRIVTFIRNLFFSEPRP